MLPPRRSDIERRIGERRLELVSLPQERRDETDRRQPTSRCQLEAARSERLVVLVVSDRDDEARRVRELLHGAAPPRTSSA